MSLMGARFLILLCVFISSYSQSREIALTFDDAPTPDSALMTGAEHTQKLITALQKANVPDALFFL